MNDIDPAVLRSTTVASAVDALKLELKFTLGDYPSDEEWLAWVKGFNRDRTRMIEIIKRRNPWAAKFSERIPTFWDDVDRKIGF